MVPFPSTEVRLSAPPEFPSLHLREGLFFWFFLNCSADRIGSFGHCMVDLLLLSSFDRESGLWNAGAFPLGEERFGAAFFLPKDPSPMRFVLPFPDQPPR